MKAAGILFYIFCCATAWNMNVLNVIVRMQSTSKSSLPGGLFYSNSPPWYPVEQLIGSLETKVQAETHPRDPARISTIHPVFSDMITHNATGKGKYSTYKGGITMWRR